MKLFFLFNLDKINLLFALAGLATLAVTLSLIFDYFFHGSRCYQKYLAPYSWPILIVATIGGVVSSLFYSEIIGIVPCSLCWLQRIALYPQALMSLVAWKQKDAMHFPLYGMALSVAGFIVAVYQYIYQALPKEVLESGLVPCLADGSADCGDPVIQVFGFVTFPFLSAVLFAFLFVMYGNMRRKNINMLTQS